MAQPVFESTTRRVKTPQSRHGVEKRLPLLTHGNRNGALHLETETETAPSVSRRNQRDNYEEPTGLSMSGPTRRRTNKVRPTEQNELRG